MAEIALRDPLNLIRLIPAKGTREPYPSETLLGE